MKRTTCKHCGKPVTYHYRTRMFCDPNCKSNYYRKNRPDQNRAEVGAPADSYTWISVPVQPDGDTWPLGRVFDKANIRCTLDHCGWPSGAIVSNKAGLTWRVDYEDCRQYLAPVNHNGRAIWGMNVWWQHKKEAA